MIRVSGHGAFVVVAVLTSLIGFLAPLNAEDKQPANEGVAKEAELWESILRRTVPYQPPREIPKRVAKANEVDVTLNVELARLELERPVERNGVVTMETHILHARTYDGQMIAPVIRVKAGDLLKVKLNNNLHASPAPLNNDPEEPIPGMFDVTNLHTHGLHVSPKGNSDNVFIEVHPEKSQDFCFDIPNNHVAGTFWFHAHCHGSTAYQLASGMAGALIIDPGPEGGIDDIPEVAEAMKEDREKILVLQQLAYSQRSDGDYEVSCFDVYGASSVPGCPRTTTQRVTLVNGVYAPTIKMRPGEVQRWRCIHAGLQEEINLAIKKTGGTDQLDLHEIAVDGLPLRETETKKEILLYPGYRTDFLLQAPEEPGEYVVYHHRKASIVPFRKDENREGIPIIARICIEGDKIEMDLPAKSAVGKYAFKQIDDDELFNRIPFEIKFMADSPDFRVNGREFTRSRILVAPRLGYPEEWKITAEEDGHPFHIHVNPFEVITKDGSGTITSRVWKDTIFVPDGDSVFVRSRFEDFSGETVLHCHNLMHEDRGMMATVLITGDDTTKSRCPEAKPFQAVQGESAENWELQDAYGELHALKDHSGSNTLLIFFRGMSCPHCRSQLDAFAKQVAELSKLDLKLVAICPDTVASLRKTMESEASAKSLPFTILSDADYSVFRAYGCYDRYALHGIFLIDADGGVRWQVTGDEPYAEIEKLLQQCPQLLESADNK